MHDSTPDPDLSIIAQYQQKRITADQAAKAILDDVARRGLLSFGMAMDRPLREAIEREIEARGRD